MTRRAWKLSALGLLAILASQSYAAGYKLEFQSASTLADAGDAAVVEDAGTNWYNSAGLVYLPMQLAMSSIDVYAPTVFHGEVNAPSTLSNPQNFPPFVNALGSPYSARGTASSHPNSLLPAIHSSMPINEKISLGFSMVPAWGFTEDYGEGSMLRYNLTRVYTKTTDFSPSIAFKVNNQWSLGFGPDLHYFSVQSKTRVRTEAIPAGVAAGIGTANDSISRFTANDWSYGGHIGLLFKYNDQTRIGLNYRSKLMMDLSGDSSFGLDRGGNLYTMSETNTFYLPLPLPPTFTLSAYHELTPCWAIMGTIAYDQWSSIQNYHARNYIQPALPTNPSGILPDVTLVQHMHDTADLSVGTRFKLTDKLMLRGSFKYEPTPTISSYRYVNFPDGVKYGFQIGARYQMSHQVALDAIYGHVFVNQARINDVNPVTGARAVGHQNTDINLLGGQLVWTIC
jgi:long-chain fatty acid transport protein